MLSNLIIIVISGKGGRLEAKATRSLTGICDYYIVYKEGDNHNTEGGSRVVLNVSLKAD
jgi:hypothetical protein